MKYPFVKIDVKKIADNARLVKNLCGAAGVEVVGVTKSCCANIAVAKAMLAGGVAILGDARLQNLERLRAAGITAPLMLLRIPMVSEAAAVVRTADFSLVSELRTLQELSAAAVRLGKTHNVILMLDMGDLREGILPQNILPHVQNILHMSGLQLQGLGTNFACYGGVAPTPLLLNRLIELANRIRHTFSVDLPVLSGGNSANMALVMAGKMPAGITQLRIGEAILLGRETIRRQPIPGTHRDAFLLYAEIVEVQEKPSVPSGECGQDAFGNRPVFIDRGIRRRAIAAIGRQDVMLEGLTPMAAGIEILGGSSDHLLLDITDAEDNPTVGDAVGFRMQYGALLNIMTSPYVEKIIS